MRVEIHYTDDEVVQRWYPMLEAYGVPEQGRLGCARELESRAKAMKARWEESGTMMGTTDRESFIAIAKEWATRPGSPSPEGD